MPKKKGFGAGEALLVYQAVGDRFHSETLTATLIATGHDNKVAQEVVILVKGLETQNRMGRATITEFTNSYAKSEEVAMAKIEKIQKALAAEKRNADAAIANIKSNIVRGETKIEEWQKIAEIFGNLK